SLKLCLYEFFLPCGSCTWSRRFTKIVIGGLCARQKDHGARTAAGLALEVNQPTVRGHNSLHRGQPQTSASSIVLCRKERFEQAPPGCGVHAAPLIAHYQQNARKRGQASLRRRA